MASNLTIMAKTGGNSKLLLKPLEQSAIYRRRIYDEKSDSYIEDNKEDIKVNYMLSSLSESYGQVRRKKLTLNFPLADVLNSSIEKQVIKDDFCRYYIVFIK